ncbi:hypothetical protein [Stutzerimonas nitrititolerans]|uniref:hypothetical protein n=1 Tax=Stutzerimonas nitrititolerans TaxID=2482751 RepID=UPI0028AD6351|nr:hypothetical protein [Stutzerimonas nitrititolerans]
MNLTIYQIMAFIGAIAGMAILFGLGYAEGRRALRQDYDAAADDHRQLHNLMRSKLRCARHERDISRHNAAQAIEALTEERDRHAEQATTLQLRLTTAQERIADLTPLTLTAEDIASLRIVNKQLLVAAQTYAGLNLLDQARFASTACERLGLVIDRIAEATEQQPETPSEAAQQERAA